MDTLARSPLSPHPSSNSISIRSAVEKFLGELPFMKRRDGRLLSKGTQDWYTYELRRLCSIKFLLNGQDIVMGNVPMLAVTAEHMASWFNTASFGECVRRLYNWHELAQPRGFVVCPKGRRDRTVKRTEFVRLLRAFNNRPIRWLCWFLWDTGARPHELRWAKWYEVNLKDRVIIRADFKAQHLRKDGVKERIIPLSPLGARILGWWKLRREPKPLDNVFLNNCGMQWTGGALRQAVRKARIRAGLSDDITAYLFRHTFIDTFAQEMLDSGTYDITLVADVAGHADLETTRIYLHRRASQLVGARDKFLKAKPRRNRSDVKM